MKFHLNSDDVKYASLWHYDRLLKKMDLWDETSDIVLNICSIQNKGIVKGRCTIYLEGDEFGIRGTNQRFYDQADLMYICNKGYLSYYPPKTRVLKSGVDPEWHYPRNVEKTHDYSFICRMNSDPVYNRRKEMFEKFIRGKPTILAKEVPPEDYPDFLSRGRIILNVLPETNDGHFSANYRVLEGCAVGTLMTNRASCIDDLGLIPNVHYLPIERYGEDFSDEELARIHETGRKYVCENFSYQNAIQTLIHDVEEFLNGR